MFINHISLLFLLMTRGVLVLARRHLFNRALRVTPADRSGCTLSSETGIPNYIECSKHCENDKCLSFSYTDEDQRCETFSQLILGEKETDISISTKFFYRATALSKCSDVPSGYSSNVYQMITEDEKRFRLLCDMDTAKGPWTVIQRRVNGKVDFHRSWADYKSGFGDLYGDFWIGNDIIHRVTNTSRILRITLEARNGLKGFAQYSEFQVASEDQKYKAVLRRFSGNVVDSMKKVDGKQFSTYDNDNDLYDYRNCAQEFFCGWWFKHCTMVNLNGRYPDIYWKDFPDTGAYLNALKTVVLMIT